MNFFRVECVHRRAQGSRLCCQDEPYVFFNVVSLAVKNGVYIYPYLIRSFLHLRLKLSMGKPYGQLVLRAYTSSTDRRFHRQKMKVKNAIHDGNR